MNINISVFRAFNESDGQITAPIEKVIQRIRLGKSREVVEAIRESTDKNERERLKKKLPCLLFSGIFTERKKEGLVKHSGLCCLDFDKYENTKKMLSHLDELKKNPHFYILFISPSGNGIKGVIRIPECDAQTHTKYFKAFQKEFQYEYFDPVTSDVSRICFESYDPDIYVNENASIFSPKLIDEGFSVSEKIPLIPITDEDKIISKIMSFNWGKDFREGERNSFIFDISGAFCEYGVSQYAAENYIINNVIIGDFPEREAINTVRSAYKIRTAKSKYFEDYAKIDSVKADLNRGKKTVIEKHGITESVYEEIKEVQEHEDFWRFDDKEKISINSLKYKLFLQRNGFKKFFPHNTQKPTWVCITSNKVTETSVEKIKDFVLNYLMDRGEIDVWNYCAKFQNLFSEQYLLMLDTVELMMLKDLKNKSFIAFENGILEVTKNEVKLHDYIDVEGYVWKGQIIQREFHFSESHENEYRTFIRNISSGDPISTETVVGYLLSTYKNKMNNKAIILNDEVISENPEGGTGKGLLIQGIRQIRNVSILDGKTFDDKKSFPYQTVSTETQVLVFDDVKKNFDFESKFSLVTEGMTLERKNKDAIKLKVEDSPKMVISTNYAIKGEGNSHDRRRFEVEIAQYYGKKITPYDEFGRQLFDDWTQDEFVPFDNYMVYCLQSYLKNGLVEQNAKNIKMRKFIAETCMEFHEWIIETEHVRRNERLDKHTHFNNFVEEYQDFKKWLTRKKFNIWIQKFCSFSGLEYQEGNSNGQRWFMIKDDNFEEKEEEVDF